MVMELNDPVANAIVRFAVAMGWALNLSDDNWTRFACPFPI